MHLIAVPEAVNALNTVPIAHNSSYSPYPPPLRPVQSSCLPSSFYMLPNCSFLLLSLLHAVSMHLSSLLFPLVLYLHPLHARRYCPSYPLVSQDPAVAQCCLPRPASTQTHTYFTCLLYTVIRVYIVALFITSPHPIIPQPTSDCFRSTRVR